MQSERCRGDQGDAQARLALEERMGDRPSGLDRDGHRCGDGAVNGGLRPPVVLPMGEQRRRQNHDDRARNRGGEEGDGGARETRSHQSIAVQKASRLVPGVSRASAKQRLKVGGRTQWRCSRISR